MTARYEGDETIGGESSVAHITLSGDLEGKMKRTNRQKLTGRLYFDLKHGLICYLWIDGVHSLLDKNRRENGKIAGQYVMVRKLNPRNEKISQAALEKLNLEPDANNTKLLFEERELGIRMLHPRRWHMRPHHARSNYPRRIERQRPAHHGRAVRRVPETNAYLNETRAFLEKTKAKIYPGQAPVRLREAPEELDQFAYQAEIGGQLAYMDYFVARQHSNGAAFTAPASWKLIGMHWFGRLKQWRDR